MRALERAGNRFERGLLPLTTGFPILEHFVAADQAGGIENERLAVCFGPEHQGRVAVPSPGDCDWAICRSVLYHAMLRQNRCGVCLRCLSIRRAQHDVLGPHKARLRCGKANPPLSYRISLLTVRHFKKWRSSKDSGCGALRSTPFSRVATLY